MSIKKVKSVKTILIVEDEKDLRFNLQEMLESAGYNVLSAINGNEALELTSHIEPDLILSDIRMPDMDGIELLKNLQENSSTANIPFIFLTAKVEMQDLRDGMVLGADDYLMKPYKIDDVLNAVNSRLKKKENYLKTVNDFKKMLSRKIPHELLTPLVGILGFSGIIENDIESLTPEEIKEMAEKIKISGQRLQRRITKFTTYMDIISLIDKKETNKECEENCEIDSVLEQVQLKNISSRIDRRADIVFDRDSAILKIKDKHLECLLNELIENALKFSEPGTPIEIIGRSVGEVYKIQITDFGHGMGELDTRRIDLFNQNGFEYEIAEGLGIGLAIVKKIVELYNGKMNIESEPEVYTCLKIELPLFNKNINSYV
ncbi:MAG TPA: response regulator [Bacteroidia bacterium]|nr:response regulator [Bacteroidia bacterium]